MIFKVNETTNQITRVFSTWNPSEAEVERYLVSALMNTQYTPLGEPLLVVNNQVRTRHKKRADILAVDRFGNGVIVELKRNEASLGVDMQALQYLAEFSAYRGTAFVQRFAAVYTRDGQKADLQQDLNSFTDNVSIEDINRHSRIILVARGFDPVLFSMGEWLSGKGVAFRCVQYEPLEIGGEKFFNFSVAFDRTPEALFPLAFTGRLRAPGYFWHNIGVARQEWWDYLVKGGHMAAAFEERPGDRGEQILKQYVTGDVVVAYAAGYGALGWGEVGSPDTYRLVERGSKDDFLGGTYLHRRKITWKNCASKLEDGIPASALREKFGLAHPLRTSVRMDDAKARKLIEALTAKFPTAS